MPGPKSTVPRPTRKEDLTRFACAIAGGGWLHPGGERDDVPAYSRADADEGL